MLLKRLKIRQNKLINLLKFSNKELYFIKPNKELSPVGWHILHCVFIECLWIRNYFLEDASITNKLQSIVDPLKIKPHARGKNLPDYFEIITFCKKIFNENIEIISSLIVNKYDKKYSIEYIIKFLENHHAQHLETIKNILNVLNIELNSKFHAYGCKILPIDYKFLPIKIKKGLYKIGTNKSFVYDNEKPENKFRTNYFEISKNYITIQNWKAFIEDGGYKNNKYWTKTSWAWLKKNNISSPYNWKINNGAVSVSSYLGYVIPIGTMPVSNISLYELKAFANWKNLKIAHEHQWEVASKSLLNKYQVWEWCNNKFYAYNGYKPFPYEEYSKPWFNNNYFTLKGGSPFTDSTIKRKSFRNFYKPSTRYICSGGRLSKF